MSNYEEYELKETILKKHQKESSVLMSEEQKQTHYLEMIAMFLSKIADALEADKESEQI